MYLYVMHEKHRPVVIRYVLGTPPYVVMQDLVELGGSLNHMTLVLKSDWLMVLASTMATGFS